MQKGDFNEMMRQRTKMLAVRVVKLYAATPKTDEFRVMGKQLLRSATSVAANYRAACRARSSREFFAKISIVVEEADETLFWLELLEETNTISVQKLTELKQEALEILKITAKARKNTKV